MRQDHNSKSDFLLEFVQLFVPLLDLLVQSLVFDLQLLKINQMKAVSKLLLFLVDLVEVVMSIAKRNVLETVLMDILIL